MSDEDDDEEVDDEEDEEFDEEAEGEEGEENEENAAPGKRRPLMPRRIQHRTPRFAECT